MSAKYTRSIFKPIFAIGIKSEEAYTLLPHPSMISFGVSKFALIFHQYDVQLYNNPCIEFDLFAHSSLDLVGDSQV